MMSRHSYLRSEISGAIAKKHPYAKNQLSVSGSFFNQFVTDIFTIKTRLKCMYLYIQPRFACLSRAVGGRFASAKALFGCLGINGLIIW